MVLINEWLPNPDGADAKGEFVELFNNAGVPVSLAGWTMRASGKKVFLLGARTIAARGYLVLTHAETKLLLKNTGESLFLYDAEGRLADQSFYVGAAPSGQSFSRVQYQASRPGLGDGGIGVPGAAPQAFTWAPPTPGAANDVSLHNSIAVNNYPTGVPLNRTAPSGAEFFGALVGVSAILAVLVVYCLKSHGELSQLFFPGDH